MIETFPTKSQDFPVIALIEHIPSLFFLLSQLSGDRSMTVRNLVLGISQEYNLQNIQVRVLPQKTLINLDASATTVENGEIAIEDGDRRLSNFELDNLHRSKYLPWHYNFHCCNS